MRKGKRQPSRAELATRPTVLSDDQFANRTVLQSSSETQQDPEGDNRKRVEYSAKFYIVQLIGKWVNISESAERVVRSRNGLRWVTFETKEYELKRANEFKPFISRFLQLGCYANIGGKRIERDKELKSITEHRYIYITSTEALRIFKEMRQSKIAPKKRN